MTKEQFWYRLVRWYVFYS